MRPQQRAGVRFAAAQMSGAQRRALQAERAEQYCGGTPRQAERVFGWSRETGGVGAAERRTGVRWLGGQSAFRGRRRWEDQPPQAATAWRALAEAQTQQGPPFRTPLAYTRVTAQAARAARRARGGSEKGIPAPRTLALSLNAVRLAPAPSPQSHTAKGDCPD